MANHFIFYVGHQTLLYLINRPIISGRIAKWMYFLQEYNFEMVYMPKRRHIMAYHLSRIDNGKPPTRVNDQLSNANLFNMEEQYIREGGELNKESEMSKEDEMSCLEYYMVYVQPKENWRKRFRKYFKRGKLLTPEATKEE